MAPKFEKNMFKIYKIDENYEALICFHKDISKEKLFEFLDRMIKRVDESPEFWVYKEKGNPSPSDRYYGAYNSFYREQAEKFYNTRYPLLGSLFKSQNWKDYVAQQKELVELCQLELMTSHGNHCIEVSGKLYDKQELNNIITTVAKDLDIKMFYNDTLPSIPKILTSNKTYSLK